MRIVGMWSRAARRSSMNLHWYHVHQHLRHLFCRKGRPCSTVKLQFSQRFSQRLPKRRPWGIGRSFRRSQVVGGPLEQSRPSNGHVLSPIWSGLKIVVNAKDLFGTAQLYQLHHKVAQPQSW
jgi:hypothetical protein